MKPGTLAFLAAIAIAVPARAAQAKNTDVIVVVDMTDDGKKIAPPTPENPAYYLPLVAGYKEQGQVVAGVKPPQDMALLHRLAVALAHQGYVLSHPKVHPPSLVLVIYWGYRNPASQDLASDPMHPGDQQASIHFNDEEMLALVAGKTLDHAFMDDVLRSLSAAQDDRYFMVVAALDYAALAKHQKKALWVAKMSARSVGLSMDAIMPALIASGAPHFGRETLRPQIETQSLIPEGQVDVGVPVVAPDKSSQTAKP